MNTQGRRYDKCFMRPPDMARNETIPLSRGHHSAGALTGGGWGRVRRRVV
jgi:hypothetical protein